jgi:hypothetical protein
MGTSANTIIGIAIIAAIIIVVYMLGKAGSTSGQTPGLIWELIINQIKIKGGLMAVIAKPNQFATGTVSPQDRHGNAAKVQADSVEYESDNTDVCTVEEDPTDETKFKLNFLTPGFATVKVKADADLGDGVVPIEGTLPVVVEAEMAVGFGVNVGEPQDNPA